VSRLRIRHGEHEVDIEGADPFIEAQLKAFYAKVASLPARLSPPASPKSTATQPSGSDIDRQFAPGEFYKLKAKGKTDGITKILIFGKYLDEFRGIAEFSRQDINNLAKEAKLPKDIHTQYFTNAVKQGLLRSHGRSRYSLTLSAEAAVSSM
jgi:hypothetical protein